MKSYYDRNAIEPRYDLGDIRFGWVFILRTDLWSQGTLLAKAERRFAVLSTLWLPHPPGLGAYLSMRE